MPNTILYIEDDPASRSLVERTLRYGGYRVLIADCALDGLKIPLLRLDDTAAIAGFIVGHFRLAAA